MDDAHGTGILGKQGRGTVLDALGDYRNTLVVGSLSKAFSCFGAFVACPERLKLLLKIRSGPIIFGGPVPPPYLDAVCRVVDILDSPEYHALRSRLAKNMEQFLAGVRGLGLTVLGGVGAIASIVVGDELATLRAGRDVVRARILRAVCGFSGCTAPRRCASRPDQRQPSTGINRRAG